MAGTITPGGLGRRVPRSFDHVDQNRLRLALPPPATVETILDPRLDKWSWEDANQGTSSACTGFGETRLATMLSPEDAPYDPWRAYLLNKQNDGWDSPDSDRGSSVHAACWVLQNVGPTPIRGGQDQDPIPADGISSVAWTMSVSAVRTCIAAGVPVLIGISWYEGMDEVVEKNGDRWCGLGNLGDVRGGHCLVIGGFSDERNAVLLYHSWAIEPVWLPVRVFSRLIREDGEIAVVTDRVPTIPTPTDPDTPVVVTPDQKRIVVPFGDVGPLGNLQPGHEYALSKGDWRTLAFTDEKGLPEAPIVFSAAEPGEVQVVFEFEGCEYVMIGRMK